MDFGIFTEQIRRGSSQGEAFGELFELVDAAEAWGLDVVWLAEMLVNPTRSVLSAPLLVASWIVARTKRLRVGTAVQLLPLNHPLRVAGEVATLDHLSHGRFDFGVGRSGGPRAYDALGVPYEESQGRFFEALEIILSAWKGEPFSYEGKFYRPAPVSAPASAGPDGRDDRGHLSARRPDGSAHFRRAARHEHPRAGGTRATLPRGVARGGARR